MAVDVGDVDAVDVTEVVVVSELVALVVPVVVPVVVCEEVAEVVRLDVPLVVAEVVAVEVGELVGEVDGVVRTHDLNSPSAYDVTASFKAAASVLHCSDVALDKNVPSEQPIWPFTPAGPEKARMAAFKSAATGAHLPPPPLPMNKMSEPSCLHSSVDVSEQLSKIFWIQATCAAQSEVASIDSR